MTMQELKIFEEKQIRTVWDEVQEKWYFCIIDIVQILTESKDYHTARKYWNKLKQRLVSEGNEAVTNCHQLKIFFRLLFESGTLTFRWLAKVGSKTLPNLSVKSRQSCQLEWLKCL